MPEVTRSPDDALAQHDRWVAALQRSLRAALPAAELLRIDTHISTLLLQGEQAYKLKKPLALGFLDFSSLAARRQACEAELRLNRRTAPQIYQALRPVIGSVTGPVDEARLGPPVDPDQQPGEQQSDQQSSPDASESAIIDWAVQMQRFDPAMGLDAMAARGELGPAHVDALAALLARFHLSLPAAPASYGDATVALHWARDSLQSLAQHPTDSAGQARLAALLTWTETHWQRLAPRLQARVAQGWIREGHGDLHLANIVWLDGQPLPFDALEFNAELRCIDVINDLAFTAMDLQAHGLPALAWRLISRWCEHTGDHAGLALLPWYAVQRALVRAKVAMISAAQEQTGKRREHLQRAERYLCSAEYWATDRSPRLVLVWGLSGTGKSTVAEQLAQALGAVRIRSDVERKRLFGLSATDRPSHPAELYSPQAATRTYARLGELASELLSAGQSLVIDAAALKQAERAALRAIAQAQGAHWCALQCVAPADVLRSRISARLASGQDASDATLAVLQMQLSAIETNEVNEASEAAGNAVLNTDLSLDALQRACAELANGWANDRTTVAPP